MPFASAQRSMGTELSLDSRLAMPSQVMARPVGDEFVILDLESGVYFGVEGVGKRIWEAAEAGKCVRDAVDDIVASTTSTRPKPKPMSLRLPATWSARPARGHASALLCQPRKRREIRFASTFASMSSGYRTIARRQDESCRNVEKPSRRIQ